MMNHNFTISHRPVPYRVEDIIQIISNGDTRLANLQRMFVVRKDWQSKLIDSAVRGFHIPAIQFWKIANEGPRQQYNINDGQQRCISLWRFVNNEFPWIPHGVEEEVYYTEIPQRFLDRPSTRVMTEIEKLKFDTYQITVVEFEPAAEEVMVEYFKRVNSNAKFKHTDWVGMSRETHFFREFLPNVFDGVPDNFFKTFCIGQQSSYIELYPDNEVDLREYNSRDEDGRKALMNLMPYLVASLNGSKIDYKHATTSALELMPHFETEISDEEVYMCRTKLTKLYEIFTASNSDHNSKIAQYTHLSCVILMDINKRYQYAQMVATEQDTPMDDGWWTAQHTTYWVNVINHYIVSSNYETEIEGVDVGKKRIPALINKFKERILVRFPYQDFH